MTLFVLQVHGNYYGTSKRAVEDVHRDGGKICILDIDVQGVKNVNKAMPKTGPNPPFFVFIKPPGEGVEGASTELRRRLTARGTETEESITKRVTNAEGELTFHASPEGQAIFDVAIVNDDLETANAELTWAVARRFG